MSHKNQEIEHGPNFGANINILRKFAIGNYILGFIFNNLQQIFLFYF